MSDVLDPGLYGLVLREPWRAGLGEPTGVTDPTWKPPMLCTGEIEWEGSTRWWGCTGCGYVGRATTTYHMPVASPENHFSQALQAFVEKRTEQGLSQKTATEQALFVAAVAMRYAATVPIEQLGQYIERHLVVR